jgi:hypothetical protein
VREKLNSTPADDQVLDLLSGSMLRLYEEGQSFIPVGCRFIPIETMARSSFIQCSVLLAALC